MADIVITGTIKDLGDGSQDVWIDNFLTALPVPLIQDKDDPNYGLPQYTKTEWFKLNIKRFVNQIERKGARMNAKNSVTPSPNIIEID